MLHLVETCPLTTLISDFMLGDDWSSHLMGAMFPHSHVPAWEVDLWSVDVTTILGWYIHNIFQLLYLCWKKQMV